jgi:glutathione peroxidase-family protein
MRTQPFLLLALALASGCTVESAPPDAEAPREASVPAPQTPENPMYEIPIKTRDGKPTSLDAYRGKALLLVNDASECGLTPQYKGLQKLHETYAERGFEVIVFPCNLFGGQVPGSPEQIQSFCSTYFDVSFPLMS